MSLAALNQPSLVAASGGILVASLPALERAIVEGRLQCSSVKLLNGLLFALNLYATSQPGRIDGRQQEDLVHQDHPKRNAKTAVHSMETYSTGSRGRTLLAPAGWAFAIWGPIFVGELVFCLSSLFVKESDPLSSLIKQASGGFMAAQLFQTLWTASFRPKYVGHALYVSSAMLSGIAYSLSRTHAVFARAASKLKPIEYMAFFLPMTLHFGWTTAAALVNVNGNVASRHSSSARTIAWLGHGSAVGASALGVLVTLTRQAPVYGGVIAWALAGCAVGMNERLEATQTESDADRAGVYGARLQKVLCGLGALLNVASSAWVAKKILSSTTKK